MNFQEETDNKGQFKLTAQIVELYMGKCLDLLNDKTPYLSSLDKWGGSDFGAFGLAEMEIADAGDIAKIIKVMHTNRETQSTGMNETSSRSHCIASICLTRAQLHPQEGRQVRRCTFMFADLAGSERLAKTGLDPSSLRAYEGQSTNWDLYNFGRAIDLVVEAKRRGRKPTKITDHLPSLLAQVMGKVLQGNSFLTMVVCLSQSEKNGGETW